jgi:outer membrane cobalamin receptor
LILNHIASENITVLAGIDGNFDNGRQLNGNPDYTFSNGTFEVNYSNFAVFTQGIFKNNILPFYVGARIDKHSEFGSAFSPRIGITKSVDNLHFKVLFNQSFRAPAIENLRYNPEVKPEYSKVGEIEVGYQLDQNNFVSANFFTISVDDPIVYLYNDEFPDGFYGNYKKTGSNGLEVEYRIKKKNWYLTANYTYFSAKGKNEIPIYSVPGHDRNLLAWPTQKVNVYSHFKIVKGFSVAPSLSYVSTRYCYKSVNVMDELILSSIPQTVYANLFLRYDGVITKGLSVGLGVYDLLDEQQTYLQPYDSRMAPLPGLGREVLLQVAYQFKK